MLKLKQKAPLLLLLGIIGCNGNSNTETPPPTTPTEPTIPTEPTETKVAPFSVVMLPDTQVYAEQYPELFYSQANWVGEQYQQGNIQFTYHVGDLVNGGTDVQWSVANQAFDTLDSFNVKYGVSIGNHDLSNNQQDFVQYFGANRTSKIEGYVGHSDNQLNSAYIYEWQGYEFLSLFLNIDASDDDIAWAQEILNKHPLPTILTTHTLIKPDGTMSTSPYVFKGDGRNSAQQVWDKLIAPNDQIFMTLNGHDHGAANIVRRNNNGLEVFQYLVDFQGGTKGGNGFLRLIELDIEEGKISHTTYSPALDEYKTDSSNEFVEYIDLKARFKNDVHEAESGELIQPIIAGYSSFDSRWGERGPTQLVDGKGIIGYNHQESVTLNSVHQRDSYDAAADHMWHSEYLGLDQGMGAEGDKTQVIPVAERQEWIAFDLGLPTRITHTAIWQYAEARENDDIHLKGAKEILVSYSSDNIFSEANFSELGKIQLEVHTPGKPLQAQLFKFPEAKTARFIRFEFLSNHGDERAVGLSEVRFLSSDEELSVDTITDSELPQKPTIPNETTDLNTFTIAKTDSATATGWKWYIGQIITPRYQGTEGTGDIPTQSQFARLDSIEVFIFTEDNIPENLYLYDVWEAPADSETLKTGVYNFKTTSGVEFSKDVQPRYTATYNPELSEEYEFNGDKGIKAVYTFNNAIINIDEQVALIFENATGLRYWQSTEYDGGYALTTNGDTRPDDVNMRLYQFKTDIDFIANFTALAE